VADWTTAIEHHDPVEQTAPRRSKLRFALVGASAGLTIAAIGAGLVLVLT
jgi:hypothetical protein